MAKISNIEIEKILKQFFYDEYGLDDTKITLYNSIFKSGLLDSIDVLKLISFLEKHFHFKVKVFELSLETLDTLEKITAYVSSQVTD